MIDPSIIKVGALALGAVLLLWPLLPKAFEAARKTVGGSSREPDLVDATKALSLVKTYLGRENARPDVESAIETLAVAVVKKGL